MNTIYRQTLIHAIFASFAMTTIPAHAAEPSATAIEVCASSTSGMVPKAKLVKALHAMVDMGETPMAATLSKEERRKRQIDAFWKEFTRDTGS